MKYVKIICFLIIFIQIIFVQKIYSSEISAGAQFLRIGLGARATAMGEAFAGLSNDINSIFYNPAGLIQIKNPQVMFLHTNWLEDIKIEYFAIADKITEKSSLGGGFFYLASGEIEKVNRFGESANATYNASDTIIILSYAREINNKLFLGLNVKSLSQKIENEQSKGFCFDIGSMYRLPKIQLGLNIQNLGGGIKFKDVSEPLPLNIKFGINYLLLNKLQLNLDINLPKDKSLGLNFGCEYSKLLLKNLKVAVRAGYKTNSTGNLSIGAGLTWKDWEINYAIVPYENFGSAHRIDLIRTFGRVKAKKVGKMFTYEKALEWYISKIKKSNLSKSYKIKILERLMSNYKKIKGKIPEMEQELKILKGEEEK